MRSLRLKILIFTNLICFGVFGQRYDFVKIIPGQAIVFNTDTFTLGRTSVEKLCRIFNIQGKSIETGINLWNGFNKKTGETSGMYSTKDIIYKSMTFEFTDEQDKNNFKLETIKLKADKTLKVYTNNGLMIGMINPNIMELFPESSKPDCISDDKLEYNLYTFGISLQLAKLPNDDLQLTEIKIYNKWK